MIKTVFVNEASSDSIHKIKFYSINFLHSKVSKESILHLQLLVLSNIVNLNIGKEILTLTF